MFQRYKIWLDRSIILCILKKALFEFCRTSNLMAKIHYTYNLCQAECMKLLYFFCLCRSFYAVSLKISILRSDHELYRDIPTLKICNKCDKARLAVSLTSNLRNSLRRTYVVFHFHYSECVPL